MENNFAIIVPYRDRPDHLAKFQLYYSALFPEAIIYIIEQEPGLPFNRGALLNAGFILSSEPYVIFHDVDMICVAGEKMYRFPPAWPTLLATRVQQFSYRMPFPEYFGGVTMFTREQYEKVNGHSNKFWSWGGEDNEMYDNIKKCGYGISYRNCYHQSLYHARSEYILPHDHPNYIYWKKGRDADDGLTFSKFQVTDQVGTKFSIKL